MAAFALALLASSCAEEHELFPDRSDAAAASTTFHLISIGANAQTDGANEVNGLGAAIVLRDEQLLFWGNGGEQTDGRGFSVAVIDPQSRELIGSVENFDTFGTRQSGTTEAARLVAFLDAVDDGMLLLLVVGDDAGITDNGTPEVACDLLEDDNTQQLLDRLSALGSSRIGDYCYRASFAMVAYQGIGRAEEEALIDGAPAHVTFTLE